MALQQFKDRQKKTAIEKKDRISDKKQRAKELNNPRAVSDVQNLDAIKRAIRQKIPDRTRKWLERNGYGNLWPKYKNWVKATAKAKNEAASALSKQLGIDLEKEHWMAVAEGGPDSEGGTGSGMFNRRVGSKPVFEEKVLQQLGIATNWEESVSNFVADRPDIKNPAERKKLKLKPLPVRKASNLAILKLQQGDLTGDQLESMMDLEYDLKKSGLVSSKNDEALLNNYLKKIHNKETALHAAKHSWKRNSKGDLILDQNKKPIPTGQWDLKSKDAFRKDRDQDWFAKRKSDSINAAKRANPKFTKLKIGAGLIGAANFLPTPSSAEQIRQEVSEGKFGDATKTYGKDLLIGHSASRAMGSAMKATQGKLAKTLGSKLARQVLKIGGRQLLKKGAALATGPLAPAVMTGLLIKDAYDVANIITGDKLKFKTNQQIRGRSGANRNTRFKATQNIRNSNDMDVLKINNYD
jgi:hypothetical protein